MQYKDFFLITSLYVLITYITIELKCMEGRYIKKFFDETVKNISMLIVLSIMIKVFISDSSNESISKIIGICFIVIALTSIFYIIDKICEYRIDTNYLKYFIYEIEVFYICMFIIYGLNQITFFSILELILLNLLNYKKTVRKENSKYDISLIIKTNILFMIFSVISIPIVKQITVFILINLLPYFIITFSMKKSLLEKSTEINVCNLDSDELDDMEVFEMEKLYDTRREDLRYVLQYLTETRKNLDEPYAFSISGKWGEGKSSFMNVLKSELRNDYIVFELLPMVTDTRESLITLFYQNLEQYFIDYGISSGKGSSLDIYFKTIITLISKKADIDFVNILNLDNSKKLSLRDKKNDLQEDINLLNKISNKKILIIVDDFDRVDSDVQYYILTFIKEIINFNKIDSMILLDYEKVNNNKEGSKSITYDFLEKFINKKFELSKLSRSEIIENYKIDIFNLKDKDDDLVRELQELCSNIEYNLSEIEIRLKKKREKLENSIRYCRVDKEKESYMKEKDIIDELLQTIYSFTSNPRKLKRIIRELKDKVEYTNRLYSARSKQQKKELVENINIKIIILGMVIIKCIYENEFDNIGLYKDIREYLLNIKEEKEYLQVKQLLLEVIIDVDMINLEYGMLNKIDRKKFDIINNLFVCINTPDDLFEFKGEREKLEDMLKNNKIKFDNEDSVKDNILGLFKKMPDEFIRNMKVISPYIISKLKDDKIPDEDLISLIQISYGKGILIKNKEYIEELKKQMQLKENIEYTNKSNKQNDINLLKLCKEEIIEDIKSDIKYILEYKRDDKYEKYKEASPDLKDLSDINKYLNEEGLEESNSYLDQIVTLRKWIFKEFNVYDDIHTVRKKERLDSLISILESIYTIKEIVDRSCIIDYMHRDRYLDISYDEIIEDINYMIKDIEDNKYKTDEQMYDLHYNFNQIINRLLDKPNDLEAKEDDIKKLDKIYRYIMCNEHFINQTKEYYLDFLSLGLKSIKEKVKNKS